MIKRRRKTAAEENNLLEELKGIDEQQALAMKSSEFVRLLEASAESSVNSKLIRDKARAAYNRHIGALEQCGYWIVKLTAEGVKRLVKSKNQRYINANDLQEYDRNLCIAVYQPVYGYMIGKGLSLAKYTEVCKQHSRITSAGNLWQARTKRYISGEIIKEAPQLFAAPSQISTN
jgi:Glu-tRNA(Gln) amidotransferase subunit E-like FAD-binding protein